MQTIGTESIIAVAMPVTRLVAPGPDVAIFYRQDGERIPDPGLIVLGKVTAGIEALNVRGPMEATIELAQATV